MAAASPERATLRRRISRPFRAGSPARGLSAPAPGSRLQATGLTAIEASARSQNPEVRSPKRKARSHDPGVRSPEPSSQYRSPITQHVAVTIQPRLDAVLDECLHDLGIPTIEPV